jgi:hypothetical protein
MSTISPDDVLVQKEVFLFHKFMKGFGDDVKVFFDNMTDKYKDSPEVVDMLKNLKERYGYVFDVDELNKEYNFYKELNGTTLEEQFHKEHNFQTSMRGIKIRGVYDTVAEATARAKKLSQTDKTFNIFVGQVGCWCPWNPVVDDIQDQEYSETQLNTLMKKYKENVSKSDELYEFRKRSLAEKAKEQGSSKDQVQTSVVIDGDGLSLTPQVIDDTEEIEVKPEDMNLNADTDPWLSRKNESTM